ncbi:hypothetical protein ILUMI_11113 [Ignelater luminosus]|uniref:NACHT domain-containing protein n=1 Tax=Ignelater luminosus TaxID=2038154 RepID=A0A8K0D5N8_IGNLU|nr:hypothetical protein ILUMI_11113 [Ignelater luminosus]
MLQLKHQSKRKLKPVTERHFLEHKESPFYLKNCIKDISELKENLDSSINFSSADITTHLGNFDKLHFLFFTNRGKHNCRFLTEDNSNHSLSLLNSNNESKIFRINLAEISDLNNNFDYIDKFYFFPNQINARDVPNKIEEEIRKITNSNHWKRIAQDFMQFIEDWSKGNLGGHYILKRSDVVSKLNQLLFHNYQVDLLQERYTFYKNDQKFVWNKIVKDKIITIIDNKDGTRIILDFLLEYIGSEVEKYCGTAKKINWYDSLSQEDQDLFYTQNAILKQEMFKSAGHSDKRLLCDVYKCLCWLGKLPLVLKINKKGQYQEILNMLQLSNYSYKIIIVNESGKTLELNDKLHHFENLKDLNSEDQEEILKQRIEFQGRSGAELKLLVDDTMYMEIKTVDIINILSNNYAVGKKLKSVPKYYIPRTFANVLSYDVLKDDTTDVFFIEDNENLNENLKTKENLETSNLCNVGSTCRIINGTKQDLEYLKIYCGETIHHLVAQNTNYLIWRQSYKETYKCQQLLSKYRVTSESSCLSNLVTLISAGPGMGKSMLLDSLAQQVPTNKWVIKIDLRNLNNYLEDIKAGHRKNDSSEHLNYFANSLYSNIEKGIFEKLVRNKDIVILVDGFDEISTSYKEEATKMVKSFYQDNFQVCLTTRPIERSHLEKELDTFAFELSPFGKDDQKQFFKKYFSTNQTFLMNSETKLDAIIEQLLEQYYVTVSNNSYEYHKEKDLIAIPLHIESVAEFLRDSYKKHLLTSGETEFKEKLNLVDLYRKIIHKNDKTILDKFGYKGWYDLCKDYLYTIALSILFPLNEQIAKCVRAFTNEDIIFRLLERGSILTIDNNFNINFSHETFAEYFAAVWLFKHINYGSEEIKNAIKSIYEQCIALKYSLLLNIFNCLLIDESLQDDNLYKHMYLSIVNGETDKATELICLDSTDLEATDKAKRSILHIVLLYGQRYPLLENTFRVILEKPLVMHEDIFGYNPIDYAIIRGMYSWANLMCEKWPGSRINLSAYKAKECIVEFEEYLHLWNSMLAYFVYRDIMLKKVRKHDTVDSYLTEHYISTKLSSKCGHTITFKLPYLNVYKKSNLCFVVTFGSKEKLEELLQTNCDKINMRDANGYAPLHYAAMYNKIEAINLLLSKNADADVAEASCSERPLHFSIKYGRLKSFCRLLHKANVNLGDNSGNTPLHFAVMHQQVNMISLLLSKGADINLRNHNGETPFYIGVKHGYYEIVSILLDYGADINLQNHEGNTPLITVMSVANKASQELDIINLLLSADANVNIKNVNGETPLYFGIRNGDYKIVREFIDKADINVQNCVGDTPLHVAISYHQTSDMITLLLLHGADVNITNVNGDTPLQLANESNLYKLYTADENVNTEGDTVLYLQILDRKSMLLHYYANVDIANSNGEAPLLLDMDRGSYQTVQRLKCNQRRRM